MISKERIAELANEHLEGSPNYLVEIKVSRTNHIIVSIDNDGGGINIKDCVALSRHIEENLDREKEDFELEVSSHGIGQPLLMLRQYKKNVGRMVVVLATNGHKFEGVMTNVTDTDISVDEEFKDPVTKKKAMRTVTMPYADIKQTIVTFKFK